MKPFNLEKALLGEPVVLRKGSKAFVRYCENKLNTIYPLMGVISCGNTDHWDAATWARSGAWFASSIIPHDNDIIGMYEEKPVFEHWGLLRDDIAFIAMDGNGEWNGYKTEPKLSTNYELHLSADGFMCTINSLKKSLLPSVSNWKNSIIERPKK